jgi:hypothetical protein
MTLLERASQFVETGGESELALLQDCVRDGGLQALAAVQLIAEHMYGGVTFNFEMKAPAAYCLITFGDDGLDALLELAERSPTSKNVSLCLNILGSIAAGMLPTLLDSFLSDTWLRDRVAEAAVRPGIREAGRTRLRTYVLSIKEEADAVSAVGSQLSFDLSPGAAVAGELFSALAIRRLAIGRPTLEEYEQLISRSPDDEPAFQLFFEHHPQLLDPMAAVVWPHPGLAGVRIPDFIVRRTDDSYVVVEIETPGKAIVTDADQLSAHATQAIAQAADYRSFLVQRFPTAAAHFPHFSEPDCLVVIGLEGQLSDSQRAALARDNRSRTALRVVGFDWITRRAEAVARNVIEAPITVESLRMT